LRQVAKQIDAREWLFAGRRLIAKLITPRAVAARKSIPTKSRPAEKTIVVSVPSPPSLLSSRVRRCARKTTNSKPARVKAIIEMSASNRWLLLDHQRTS
jgi:hypothetical protein